MSIDFQKMKSMQKACAVMRHNDKEERQKHEHRNKDIDTEKTKDNRQVWDYQTSRRRLSERIKTLDETTNTNRRKDRVIALGITIALPEGLKEEDKEQCAKLMGQYLMQEFGRENIAQFSYHVDEVHQYREPITGETKMSREHVHAVVVPEQDGKLQAKNIMTKTNMSRMNRELDGHIYQRFGVHLLTGEKPLKRSVEELKHMSKRASVLQKEKAALQAAYDRLQEERDGLYGDCENKSKEITALKEARESQQEEIYALQEKLEKAEDWAQQAVDRYTFLFNKFQSFQKYLSEDREFVDESLDLTEDERRELKALSRVIDDDEMEI